MAYSPERAESSLTESPKSPARPAAQPAGSPDASSQASAVKPTPAPTGAASSRAAPSSGPPPPPIRGNNKPSPAPIANKSEASSPLAREPARDTLAPSSFGVLGGAKPLTSPAPTPVRGARAPLPTLGELEGATATATLRPPGAVPPPPRALPMTTPNLDVLSVERGAPLETPLPGGVGAAQSPTAPASALPSPRTPPYAPPVARDNSTMVSRGAPTPAVDAALEATLDMSASASKKATQASLIEQTRVAGGGAGRTAPQPAARNHTPVPAPGLFIADEPLERRPQQPSLVTAQRELLTRLRVVVLVLGGLLLMAAGALVVMAFRRADANAARAAAPSASAAAPTPGCALVAPPSRISTIERTVPLSALGQADGTIALAIAESKTTAAGWIYDPKVGEPKRKLDAPTGNGDVTHVNASEPLVVDRADPDFAFAQTLTPGLALGVGPAGLLRRGDDGAAGVVWPLGVGVRVTPPRAVSTAAGHFVAFRQGGAEGQIMTGWLHPDGSAAGPLSPISGVPQQLGTPNVSRMGERVLVLFSARADKSEPYRVYAAIAAPGQAPTPAQALPLPAEGGGALTPSLAALPGNRYLVQWTDGNVGQYQVHVRTLDDKLQPTSEALLVSGKGANAGQGSVVTTPTATVSFFIQTTAGHDELWGATLSCH